MKKHKLLQLLVPLLSFFTGCASSPVSQKESAMTVDSRVVSEPDGIPHRNFVPAVDSLDSVRRTVHVFVGDSSALPTRAALDFAAYFKNPIRDAGKTEMPEKAKPISVSLKISEYPFPMLDSLSENPSGDVISAEPIAWEPFTKFLYAQGSGDVLAGELRKVESVKWGMDFVSADFQKVDRLALVQNGTSSAWWIRVSPRPWTGKAPFWARLSKRPDSSEIAAYKLYVSDFLDLEHSLDWIRALAAYWYPALNTDLEPHEAGAEWYGTHPFSVMRGNPMGTPQWIAFDVPAFRVQKNPKIIDKDSATQEFIRLPDTSSAWRKDALKSLEGTCPETEAVKAFRHSLSRVLDSLPSGQNAWNANGMLWFRRDANSLLADDFTAQDSLHDPLPRILEMKAYFDSLGIQFLFVPIPTKEAIYADKLVTGISDTLCIDAAGREFIRKLLDLGVDVLDVYPALKNARSGEEPPRYAFQRYDTHWTLSGLLPVMEELANKVTSYAWYADAGAAPGTLEMRDTTILREGDLVIQLSTAEQGAYAPDTLEVKKIYRNGKAYVGTKSSPILLMGDSFTGVFESVDGKSGGPASLLAFATGLDVQVMTSWGGGPGVRHRMKKDGKSIASKRLVIYMMTMRDFWQSPMEWDAL